MSDISSGGRLERVAWAALATTLLPIPLARCLWSKEWRQSVEERCGGSREELAALEGHAGAVWLHGASLGEVAGLLPIAEQLRANTKLFATTTSTTGKAEALKRGLAPAVRLLPFDHPMLLGRLIDVIRPRLFIIAETELWPNLFLALKSRNIPLVIVNGRISNRTFPRYLAVKRLFAPLLTVPTKILAQTDRDRERYLALGADPERVRVTGSTKYAQRRVRDLVTQSDQLFLKFGMRQDTPLLVLGSVRPGEDQLVIDAYSAVRRQLPSLQLIIAPRHPDRFDGVADLLRKAGLRFSRRSQQAGERSQVLLLDSIGELVEAYSIASVSYVGATLVPIGGHNPLEPAAFATPVVMGPHYGNVTDAVDELLERGGISIVESGDALTQQLLRLLRDPALREKAGRAAFEVWERNSTSIDRVMPELLPFLNG